MPARIRKKGQSILVSIWVSSFFQPSQEQLEIFICTSHNESKHCGAENKDKKIKQAWICFTGEKNTLHSYPQHNSILSRRSFLVYLKGS